MWAYEHVSMWASSQNYSEPSKAEQVIWLPQGAIMLLSAPTNPLPKLWTWLIKKIVIAREMEDKWCDDKTRSFKITVMIFFFSSSFNIFEIIYI